MKTNGTLVILTPGFAAPEDDSTCLPMQQSLIRTITEIYPQLNVVVLGFQYPYVQKKYKWFEATVYSFNGRNHGGVRRLLLRRKIKRVLKDIHTNQNIIGLLSFWYGECAAVGHLFGKKFGYKHCCWLLGQDARKGNKYPRRCSLPAASLIALSDFLQVEFERNYAIKPAHVIPPGIHPEHMPLPAPVKDIDILGTGSFIALKQYEKFISVVGEIKKTLPAINVVLVGDGPQRANLQKLIAASSLQDTVHLTGELPYPEVLKTMRRTKVFLHTSSYEGFGVVCLEALYAGARVLSFVQPMRRKIEGWQIVSSEAEMTKQALKILQSPFSAEESQTVFSMKDTAEKLVQLFLAQEA